MGKNKKVKPNGFTEFMFEFIAKERYAGRNHKKVIFMRFFLLQCFVVTIVR